jgi:hypothetical protein
VTFHSYRIHKGKIFQENKKNIHTKIKMKKINKKMWLGILGAALGLACLSGPVSEH